MLGSPAKVFQWILRLCPSQCAALYRLFIRMRVVAECRVTVHSAVQFARPAREQKSGFTENVYTMTRRDSRTPKSAVSNPSRTDFFTFTGFLSLKDDGWNIGLNLTVRKYFRQRLLLITAEKVVIFRYVYSTVGQQRKLWYQEQIPWGRTFQVVAEYEDSAPLISNLITGHHHLPKVIDT
jgi:hypothetical protein